MQTFIRENGQGLALSLVGHGVLFVVMGLNLVLMTAKPQRPVAMAIEATVIDVGEIRRHQEALERKQEEIDQARRKRQEAERRKIEQAKVAERRRDEQAAKDSKAETERKAEQQQQAEAERERKAEEARQAEAQRQAEAEDKRRQDEMESELRRELEAEEQRLVAIRSGKLAEYLALIEERVERNWVQPASATEGIECVVHVTQIPGGEVVSVRVGRCNGDKAVARSIEAAVYNASPLPLPGEMSLFDRNLRFTFKPKE